MQCAQLKDRNVGFLASRCSNYKIKYHRGLSACMPKPSGLTKETVTSDGSWREFQRKFSHGLQSSGLDPHIDASTKGVPRASLNEHLVLYHLAMLGAALSGAVCPLPCEHLSNIHGIFGEQGCIRNTSRGPRRVGLVEPGERVASSRVSLWWAPGPGTVHTAIGTSETRTEHFNIMLNTVMWFLLPSPTASL